MNKNILVSRKDIIKTYSKKQQELAFQFLIVTKIRQKTGWSKYKLAEYLKFPIGRIKHWIYDEVVPIPIKTVNKLKNSGLIPLYLTNMNFPLIVDCFAFVLGDGYLSKNLVSFSSKNKDDLKNLQEKLKNIRFEGHISKRIIKNHMMPDGRILNGQCYHLKISSCELGRLLIALGCPEGDKTLNPIYLPKWLLDSSKEIKSRFLGVFYGNEGGSPVFYNNSITSLRIKLVKDVRLKNEHEQFMKQIKDLFAEFETKTSKIRWEKRFNKRKDGIKTQPSYFNIKNNLENFLKFSSRIPILYNSEKNQKIMDARKKVIQKVKHYSKRCDKYNEALKLYNKGVNVNRISLKIGINYKTIEYWIKKGGKPILFSKKDDLNNLLKESCSFFPRM